MKLPKDCPNCGIDIKDTCLYAHGVQYCYGNVMDDIKEGDNVVSVDLQGSGSDWLIDPYKIECGECEHILWTKEIIIGEKK